uniref:Uncharacterized protein n=1 Tax=Siphoviridae sp. ctqBH20 TaxID=2825680 RepID=A0A8S5QB50_9CAUD|nr:MAG TPA: hypothetical protein [Siphoviridae sp. ctqBH20]
MQAETLRTLTYLLIMNRSQMIRDKAIDHS